MNTHQTTSKVSAWVRALNTCPLPKIAILIKTQKSLTGLVKRYASSGALKRLAQCMQCVILDSVTGGCSFLPAKFILGKASFKRWSWRGTYAALHASPHTEAPRTDSHTQTASTEAPAIITYYTMIILISTCKYTVHYNVIFTCSTSYSLLLHESLLPIYIITFIITSLLPDITDVTINNYYCSHYYIILWHIRALVLFTHYYISQWLNYIPVTHRHSLIVMCAVELESRAFYRDFFLLITENNWHDGLTIVPEICTHALERTTWKYIHPGSPTWRRLAAGRA